MKDIFEKVYEHPFITMMILSSVSSAVTGIVYAIKKKN